MLDIRIAPLTQLDWIDKIVPNGKSSVSFHATHIYPVGLCQYSGGYKFMPGTVRNYNAKMNEV